MEKNKRQQPVLSNQAIRWDAYHLRDSFSLFELACLVNRLDPEAVHDDAVAAVKRHGGPMADVFARDHVGAVKVMYNSPAMYFIPPVGDTLAAMKQATSQTLGYTVSTDRAKQIAQGLGYQWPVELEHQSPRTVESVAGPLETERAEQRQARRWQLCIDAGLTMPAETYAHLPRGVSQIAKAEKITRQALTQDLNAHRERLFGK